VAQRLKTAASTRTPRPRTRDDLPGEGYLFPGEVAELLDCGDIDYHQLRRLFRLVRTQAGVQVRTRKWARYTLKDVAALRIALELCGGSDALARGKHLQMAALEHACTALRVQGVANPLLDVPLHRMGAIIVAEINGVLFDPTSGQTTLRDSRDRLQQYLDDQLVQLDDEANGLTRDQMAAARAERRDVGSALAREASSRSLARDAAQGVGEVRFSHPRSAHR
jgi:hypothetical protein